MLRRIALLLTAVTLAAAMVLISALSSAAQENDGPFDEPPPFEDISEDPSWDEFPFADLLDNLDDARSNDEPPFRGPPPDEPPPFEDTTPFRGPPPDEPPPFEDTTPAPSPTSTPVPAGPICAPEWLQEWYPDWAIGWWYFYWYQSCYTVNEGWYRSYDGWAWGPPIW